MTPFHTLKPYISILMNGIKISLVVGTILNLINQGEQIMSTGELNWGYAFMNYLVPFCVANYSGFVATLEKVSTESKGALDDPS